MNWYKGYSEYVLYVLYTCTPTELASPAESEMTLILERLCISPAEAICQGDKPYMQQSTSWNIEWWKMRDWLRVGSSGSWDDAVLGRYSILWMPYSVYEVHGVNSWWWHGEMERDDLTLNSSALVELRTRKREINGEGGNNYEKLGLTSILCTS